MEMKGSKTERCLMKAFAGESQARNRYTYFASVAKKEGYEQIAAVFEETASQEKEHAKRFFNFMQGGEIEITATFPAGPAGCTLDNLRAAAMGEKHEYTELYPVFARTALEEGFTAVAAVFEAIGIAETYHGDRYSVLADRLEKGETFKSPSARKWRCRNCGYIHEGTEAPLACPACTHPRAWFEALQTV
jgi:rubrerythrin